VASTAGRLPRTSRGTLRARLRASRWPDPEPVADDSQGVPLERVRALCAHWADGYDWRATEAELNALPQFRARAGGLGIHLVHARSRHPDALPLVLTHGWPGVVDEVAVPAGCAVFPQELQRPSRRWAERRFTDIRHWSEPPRGGHFAALEQPALHAEDLRALFRLVR
jgi:hypothetical protein